MNYYVAGILAHVDAGKTTLSESLMYNLGKIKALGRVDKGNAFLDTDPLEKERGITIFSKQALLDFDKFSVTLLDTPGHVDFSAETERVLSVLDFAVLVISGAAGIQSHTRTLWRLLKSFNIPVIIFVNKMDQEGADKGILLEQINKNLSGNSVDFSAYSDPDENFLETIATLDEDLMESYLSGSSISRSDIQKLFINRKLFPVLFGAALKNEGISELIDALKYLVTASDVTESTHNSSSAFGARVFKISRDAREERLTHMKVLQGAISVRESINDEKVTSIRVYDGEKYTTVNTAIKGQVVAVTGLTATFPGQGLGSISGEVNASLTPVLSYELILPDDINKSEAVEKLMKLSEEQPDLSIDIDTDSSFITISLMGEVQTEVLKRRIKERFDLSVEFGKRRTIYKETIDNVVEGVGHFEPLRHYAEVHLLMEPLPCGSGMEFATDCSEDILDKNWQRLILTHLKERIHRGVLTRSAITDMKITVVSGRAHQKHTEGGDFRQATYRAVRQGLMQANCHLLEPYYDFTLEVPTEYIGRAMTDLEMRNAKDFSPEIAGEIGILKGSAPVSTLAGYGADVTAYTSGLGNLTLSVKGYGPCHNEEEVIAEFDYDPLRDTRNTADSVFCSHGSSDIIPWDQVKQHMHMPSVLAPTKELTDEQIRMRAKRAVPETTEQFISPEEVDSIIRNAGSANKKSEFIPHKGINHKSRSERPVARDSEYKSPKPREVLPEYLLVDGYNVIYAWDELKDLARENLDGARGALLDILCDYQAMRGVEVIAVFDAYRLKAHPEEFIDYHNIHLVYTRTAQTADYYIERFAIENRKKYRIRVATSDNVEQVIVRGENCTVVSSTDFRNEVYLLKHEFKEQHGVK